MRKRVPIMIAAALTACGAVATTSNDSAESAPQKSAKAKQPPRIGPNRYDEGGMAGCFDPRLSGQARAAAERIGGVPCETETATSNAGGGDWVGEYRGPFDGANGVVTISRTRAGLAAEVAMSSDHGCGGSVSGPVKVEADRLTLIKSGEEGPQCRIVMTRDGASLDVSDSGCTYFHGRSCEFTGRVTRVGSASRAATRPAAAQSATWIVGTWVLPGNDCNGEVGITYWPDGAYSTHMDSGQWRLEGTTLTHTTLETYVAGDESSRRAVRNPQGSRSQIVAHSANSFTHRKGPLEVRLMRCPD